MDTWSTGCTPEKLRGRVNIYATGPTCSRNSKGLIYHILNLPFLPNLITPFVGETFRRELSLVWNYMSLTLWSTYFFCLLWVDRSLSSMLLTLFSLSFINRPPKVAHIQPQTNLWLIYIPSYIAPQMVTYQCFSLLLLKENSHNGKNLSQCPPKSITQVLNVSSKNWIVFFDCPSL